MKRLDFLLIACLLCGLLLSGCTTGRAAQAASVDGRRFDLPSAGEDIPFTINVDQALLDSGQPIQIMMRGQTEKGQITYILRDAQGKTVWYAGDFGGQYNANGYYKPETTGYYQLGITWKRAAAGTYSLAFQAGQLSPLVLIPGMGMLMVAVGFVIYGLRRGATWGYLGLGALTWVVTVAVKFAWAIPINPIVFKALNISMTDLYRPGNLLAYLYVGSLTGFTEILMAWLLLRYTRLGRVGWNKALAFGIGVGAFEAALLSLSPLIGGLVGIIAPQALPIGTMSGLIQVSDPAMGLAPVAERFGTILCHIFSRVLLFYAILKGQPRWLWLSFVFMTLLDTVGAFAQFWGVGTPGRMWTIEVIVLAFGLAGWWGIREVRANYMDAPAEQNSYKTIIDIPDSSGTIR